MNYTYEQIAKMISHSLLNPIMTDEVLEEALTCVGRCRPNAFRCGAQLPWAMKPKRSCCAITLMTVVAFVTTVFVRLGDVADGIK